MKRVVSVFAVFILIYINLFSAFSFDVDGIDSGTEWDGATIYTLIDGESNCRVNLGLVKVKFDYETDALNFCFLFSDPDFTADNLHAGISLSVDNSTPFEVTSSAGSDYQNILPYSFEGAVILDDNKGATCEIRVGFKSGLPETINCSVRYIDSQGSYSNYYNFEIINELYVPDEILTVIPSVNNNDSSNYNTDKTSKKSTTKKKTTEKDDYTIKTSPPYSYTGRTKKSTTKKTIDSAVVMTSKPVKTKKETVKVYYYEKEVYISEIFISETISKTLESSSENESNIPDNITISNEYSEMQHEDISLSKGTKYKKVITCVGLAAFITLAVIGVYSAKKGSDK